MFSCLSRRKPVTSGLSSSVLIACLLVAVINFTIAQDTEPICKNNKKVCEDIEDYPASIVEELIKKDLRRYMDQFEVDEPSVGERAGHLDEESLCHTKERIIYPKRGYGKDRAWHYIVNHDDYRQGIRTAECSQANRTCNMTENFPSGYKSACRQDFIYRSLLAYDREKNVTKQQFLFPSTCRCFVSNMPDW